MYAHSFEFPYTDTLPMLDEGFDKGDNAPLPLQLSTGHAHSGDDLEWADQLDNGEEMSL